MTIPCQPFNYSTQSTGQLNQLPPSPRHHTTHARHTHAHTLEFVHLPHHLAHLVKLLHKGIYICYVLAAAFRYTLAAAAVYHVRVVALVRGHRVDDGLYALKCV